MRPNAHVQTLLAARPSLRGMAGVDEVFPLPDGDALIGVVHAQPRPARWAVVVHGVGGSSESPNVVRMARALYAAGMSVVRLTLRGSGRGLVHASRFYHAGLVDDVIAVIDRVAARADVLDVVVVGHSLGGATTLLLAGRAPPVVRACAAVSAPLDLDGGADFLERWPAAPYAKWLVRGLVAQAVKLQARTPGALQATARDLARIATMRGFDDVVTAPMHGFASAAAYYAAASPGPRLADVRVPTLLLHAADDPIVPWSLAAPHAVRAPPSVEVVVVPSGGHVGFVDSVFALWGPSLAARAVTRFFAAVA